MRVAWLFQSKSQGLQIQRCPMLYTGHSYAVPDSLIGLIAMFGPLVMSSHARVRSFTWQTPSFASSHHLVAENTLYHRKVPIYNLKMCPPWTGSCLPLPGIVQEINTKHSGINIFLLISNIVCWINIKICSQLLHRGGSPQFITILHGGGLPNSLQFYLEGGGGGGSKSIAILQFLKANGTSWSFFSFNWKEVSIPHFFCIHM